MKCKTSFTTWQIRAYCTVSRYRPPTPAGSKYITPEGAKRLRDELHELWHDERPRVTAAVAAAAAQGDRSENAEYTYGKKRLHEIDRRVRFLRKRLEGMVLRRMDDYTLEADISKDQNLNQLFAQLSSQGVEVLSMRNKVNRLEEIFMQLVENRAHHG